MNHRTILIAALFAALAIPGISQAQITNAGDGGGAGAPTTQGTAPVSNQGGTGTTQTATPSTATNSQSTNAVNAGNYTGFVPLAPIPGLTDAQSNPTTSTLAVFFNNLYKYLIGIASALAVIMVIWGGIEIATQDSVAKQGQGRRRIQQALFGLILVLSPAFVFGIVNSSILNLSVNIPALDTATVSTSTPSFSTNGGNTASTTDASTGCTVSGTLLQKASCSTQAAAQAFASKCSGTGDVQACQAAYASGACADKTYFAICSVSKGPYEFVDVSQSGWTFQGVVNGIVGYSKYEPVAKSASDPTNGTDVLQFASNCTSDGGAVCLSDSVLSGTCTYTSALSTSQSNSCYYKTLTCQEASFLKRLDGCGTNPQYTIIQ